MNRPALVPAITLLLIAFCTSPAAADPQPTKGPISGPTAPPKLPTVATAKFNPADAKNSSGSDRTGAGVSVNGFKADGQGLGVLYWTLRNENVSGVGLGPGNFASERWGSSPIRPDGVSIVDDRQRHATLVHDKGCLCYMNPPGIAYSSLDKGSEMQLAQVFVVSPTAKQITVEIPGFHPVRNVPVQR